MKAQPYQPQLLPRACLLCGAPYITAQWRAKPTPYGVLYLCHDCCQHLGPQRAYLMARHFLATLAALAETLRITGALAAPLPRVDEP